MHLLKLGLVLCVHTTLAAIGVDVSEAVSESQWKCLQTPGGQGAIEFVMVRVGRSTGTVDPNAAATIKAARAAGIKRVDGYLFPCYSCGDAAGQVRAASSALQAAGGSVLWYDIEPFKWSKDLGSNQAFVRAMIDEGVSLDIKAGVYTNWNSWGEIVGSGWDYASAKGLPVWYPHYDSLKALSDFKPFGGWNTPTFKQYAGDKSSCGVGVDYNYAPSFALAELTPGARAVDLNVTCSGGSNVDGGACIVHDHADGSYSTARSHLHLTLGRQLDVVHLQQAMANRTYGAPPSWCVSPKSHVTAAGNLVLVLGHNVNNEPGARGTVQDCSSHTADLDVGDCTSLTMGPQAGAYGEELRVCFNGALQTTTQRPN
eukprot:g7707.t1